MKDTRVRKTATAMFDDPQVALIPYAWRILLHATDGKQFSSGEVKSYWKDHVARWSDDEPGSAAGPSPPQSARMLEEPISDSIPQASAAGPPPPKGARISAEDLTIPRHPPHESAQKLARATYSSRAGLTEERSEEHS